jgi:hypothetical protein
MFFGKPNVNLCFIFTVKMQPWFMVKGMVPYLVSGGSNGSEDLMVLFHCRILTDDEESDGQLPSLEKIQDTRHQDVQVRGKRLPPRVTVRLHIRPLVVEVE